MADYCEVDDVVDKALITDYSEESDPRTEQIEACIDEAMAYIDNKLYKYVEILPLETVPALVRYATADIATALFLQRHLPERYNVSWWTSGNLKIEEYIKSIYKKGKFILVGDETDDEVGE